MSFRRLVPLPCAVAVFAVLLAWASSAFGATENVLHAFQNTLPHGSQPHSELTADAAGNLYGTTHFGGAYQAGTVYKLTPSSGGGWTQTVLYTFKGGTDGSVPYAPVIFDGLGNLYGTTILGGTGPCGGNGYFPGCGTVFKLTPDSRGGWTESILYSFLGGNDGDGPAGLVFDSSGNLYGTTVSGGTGIFGTVFQLTPNSSGVWSESILHNFTGGSDGASPYASLIFDAAGNLYGTASLGGASTNNGVVFELTPTSQGTWTENVLYKFAGSPDGALPASELIFDGEGNLYGTTGDGGVYGYGTVFELKANGIAWTESVLYSFGIALQTGLYPVGSIVFDRAGNLYGMTNYGGGTNCDGGCGIVFQLTPNSSGQWTENLLHGFSGGVDGGVPYAGLIIDQSGNLYGTTGFGGPANLGAVFKLAPLHGGHWKQTTIYSFEGGDGTVPFASLVVDSSGNLYGTTTSGGTYENGSVFKLTRNSSGDWTTTLLYSFKGASDGSDPNGALVFDRLGNLYGTTVKGGPYANGTVFQLAPLSNGTWAERVLYSFQALPDGQYPYAGLTFDTLGNLFGTTYSGGNSNTNGCGYTGCGVVFELKPSSGGKWAESVIYAFNGGTDGDDPYYGSLAIDAAGNLFGTTFYTGCSGCSSGTVFEISPNGSGGWTHFVIYSFTGGNDGGLPTSGVTLDSAGNLYGTTSYYGAFGSGTVFELKPSSGGWIESTLYSFTGGTDGARPFSGVVLDAAGNLYGTTFEGGTRYCPLSGYSGCGVVYKLAPGTSQWSYTSLYTFTDKLDGANPNAGVVLDGAGNLYGTTEEGGKTNSGVVFEVAP